MSSFQPAHNAFTNQSVVFDDIDEQSPIIKWMRKRTYQHIFRYFKLNSKVLELNAGTGIDAFAMSQKGYSVLATDASEGMLSQLRKKISDNNTNQVRALKLPFQEFNTLNEKNFDAVFSNFGGLNCNADLNNITHHLPNVLNKGAIVTWVLISPWCFWEWLFVLKGNFNLAFRRLKKRNVKAHLEGVNFATFYYSPKEVKKAFGKNFKCLKIEGLATFTPPPYLDWIALRYPKIFRLLSWLDSKTCHWPVLNVLGDHYIITFKYLPNHGK